MKVPNSMRPLYGVGEHNTKMFLFLLHFCIQTQKNFASISQIKCMKFETVRIHFLSDVFSLLSSRNFATMATWRNFSSLLAILHRHLYRNVVLFSMTHVICAPCLYHWRKCTKKYSSGSLHGWCLENPLPGPSLVKYPCNDRFSNLANSSSRPLEYGKVEYVSANIINWLIPELYGYCSTCYCPQALFCWPFQRSDIHNPTKT